MKLWTNWNFKENDFCINLPNETELIGSVLLRSHSIWKHGNGTLELTRQGRIGASEKFLRSHFNFENLVEILQ